MGILQISTYNILLPLSHHCRSKPLPLPGRSWLATIAELMGLVRLFSFPLAGSIDPACIHSCSHNPLLSLTQPHTSPGHTPVGPLALFISCPSLCRPQISLFHSFAIPPCVHYLDLLDVRCTICRTCDVNFCLLVLCLYLLPPLLLSYQFFSSFFLVPSVPPSLISHCLLTSFLYNPLSVYPSSFIPNSPKCFIGAVCNSLPTHFSWLRCSTTFEYNIESVKQKHYRT